MARIQIIIEDNSDGTVQVVSTPNFQEMAQIDASGKRLTSAHGYAMRALNAIRDASREQGNRLNIWIPRVGR